MSDLAMRGPLYGGNGTTVPRTAGFSGATRVQAGHATHMDAVSRGNVWLAANQAGAALSNLSATATGFILTNPAASGKLLVLLEIGFFQTSTAAATANAGLQLAANVNPVAAAVIHTTPLVLRNALLGSGGTGVGLADSAATLPAAPAAILNLWQPSVSATATTAIPPALVFPVDGKIIVGQGCTVSLSALSALSGAAHMLWEEVQIY